jgi:peptide/nickel transport system permease protein
MAMVMLAVSVLVFFTLELVPGSVATKVLGPYSTVEQREVWLSANGYDQPALFRYFNWLGNLLTGDFGISTRYKVPVADILWPRLWNTAILAFLTMCMLAPLSLALGVLSGMREGSLLDRVVTFGAILTSSIPEFASAVLFYTVLVFLLGWLPATSNMASGFDLSQMVLPVLVLVTYGTGYITRITRASMIEVMRTNYIRTAVLKGMPRCRVILRHAFPNAMVAPLTVLMMQINWLMSGVVVVEFFFAYKGFGALILEAALNQDIYVVEAGAMIAVFVAIATQMFSDIGYMVLNPRVRLAGQT